MGKIKSYFSDKAFFKAVMAIALPMMIQNGITNFVGVLDNIMVGQISAEATSGVAIVSQFMFIFYLLTFGAISAAGIFTAQYHGKGDILHVRATFRAKMMICLVVSVVGIVVFSLFGGNFINLFLSDAETEIDAALTFAYAKDYMFIMLFGIVPYSLTQAYSSTLRETEKTVPPLVASTIAVAVNLLLNFLLIFGHLGLPALGVVGAGIATVISRYVEFLILVIWTAKNKKKCPFIVGAYKSMKVPAHLLKKIVVMGLPLMANEALWALAETVKNQCFSTRGLDAVTALSITMALTNMFNIVYFSIGASVSVIIGNMLGAGKIEEAKKTDKKMLSFAVLCSLCVVVVLAILAPIFPKFYKAPESVTTLSMYMTLVFAFITPFIAYAHAAYFTLRTGGKIIITVLFDSVYMWVIVVPVSVILAYFTPVNIWWLFPICQGLDIVKAGIGMYMVKRGTWAKRIVSKNEEIED